MFAVTNAAALITAFNGGTILTNLLTGVVIVLYLFCATLLTLSSCAKTIRIGGFTLLFAYTVFVGAKILMFYFGSDA
jgi:hypothetical protein